MNNTTTLHTRYPATSLANPTGGTELPTPTDLSKRLGIAIRNGTSGKKEAMDLFKGLPYWINRAAYYQANPLAVPRPEELQLSEEIFRQSDSDWVDDQYSDDEYVWTVDSWIREAQEIWDIDYRFDAHMYWSGLCRWLADPDRGPVVWRNFVCRAKGTDNADDVVLCDQVWLMLCEHLDIDRDITRIQYERGHITELKKHVVMFKDLYDIQTVWSDEYTFIDRNLHANVQAIIDKQHKIHADEIRRLTR